MRNMHVVVNHFDGISQSGAITIASNGNFIDFFSPFHFVCSENEILEHDSVFDVFYMSFAALAANNISGQCNARK